MTRPWDRPPGFLHSGSGRPVVHSLAITAPDDPAAVRTYLAGAADPLHHKVIHSGGVP
jgi:hypothetical protein